MNKKTKTLFIILGVIIFIFVFFIVKDKFVVIYNDTFIEKYVDKYYPDYKILDYSYLGYGGMLWESEEELDKDYINYEVICDTLLQHKDTGMYVSIPFYHDKYWVYKDYKYSRKDIKKLVAKYEIYWKSLHEIAKKYNTEIKVSNAIFDDDSENDIDELTLFFPTKIRNANIINEINDIDVDIRIQEINFVFCEKSSYQALSPWIEPNMNIYDNLSHVDKGENYTIYVESYNINGENYESYYGVE